MSVEIADETVMVVDRMRLAGILAERRRWAQWWPGLEVVVVSDRGREGMTWAVSGPLVGSSAVSLIDQGAGLVLRYRLSVDPTEPGTRTVPRRLPDSPHGRRELASLRRRQELAWKRVVWALVEELAETDRFAG